MYVQPLNVGWHFGKRVDFTVGYGFMAPTGQYTSGASSNIGSGYWGHNINSGTTLYITKNKGTSANLATDWETHGRKSVASVPAGQTSKMTPGQAFTTEWGIGQVLPLKKDLSILAQLGFVGYDQWQVSSNGGNYLVLGRPVPARLAPITPSAWGKPSSGCNSYARTFATLYLRLPTIRVLEILLFCSRTSMTFL